MYHDQDKIVVVTRKTRLEELTERFNTREQAKFFIEHMQQDFSAYDREHEVYTGAVHRLRKQFEELGRKVQAIDWTFLPNFLFGPADTVVTIGRDGLVVNTAKYLNGQAIVAVNPDPERNDGILLPFSPETAVSGLIRELERRARYHQITMAEVSLNDGQRLSAFNDFYLGQRTHISSRYRITWHGRSEEQSSSGVLVSTGAGSTGWLSSTCNMAAAVANLLLGRNAPPLSPLRLSWDDPRLAFVVREPFRSKASDVKLSAGLLEAGESLLFESHMPEGGVIFSDGVEADALAFNSGAVGTVRASDRKAKLVAADRIGVR
jgi:NAD kinase